MTPYEALKFAFVETHNVYVICQVSRILNTSLERRSFA